MELSGLLSLISGMPSYRRLLKGLGQEKAGVSASVIDAARPYLAAALHKDLGRPVLMVTAGPEHSRRLQDQVNAWLGAGRVLVFPEPDALPYQRVVTDPSAGLERIGVLSLLAGKIKGVTPPFIIASALALMQKVMPHKELVSAWHKIEKGMSTDPRKLIEKWLALGYRIEELVEAPGTIGRRGGILDIFPASSDLPVRIEFLGNTVDSIREFDTGSQRSEDEVGAVEIGPATELLKPLSGDTEGIKKAVSGLDCRKCAAGTEEQLGRETAMLLDGRLPDDAGFMLPCSTMAACWTICCRTLW